MVMERDLTWGGEHKIQYIDNVLQNCAPEPCIILVTNVTPTNSVKKQNKNDDLGLLHFSFLLFIEI